MASAEPLRMRMPGRLTPLMRVWALKGTNSAWMSLMIATPQVVLLLGQDDDGAAFGGFVGERGELRGVGQALFGLTSGAVKNSVAWRLPRVMVPVLSSSSVFTSPAASTARPLMARTLYWTRRSMPAIPMADSSPPMVVGIRQTSSDTSTKDRLRGLGVHGKGLQRDHGQQKDDGEAGEQNAQRDLVGSLLAGGAFDQRDHAVQEGLAGVGGDSNLDPVRERPSSRR
jgi:hypothetical protein